MNTAPIMASAITAFAATLSAGIFIKKIKDNIGIICAVTAGFFISLSLFDVLPDILALAPHAQISFDILLLPTIAGFAFLLALDQGIPRPHMKTHTMTKKCFPTQDWLVVDSGILFSRIPRRTSDGRKFSIEVWTRSFRSRSRCLT